MAEIIYMPLVEEGTEVWRPVQAERQAGGDFKVLGQVPNGEIWSFSPGAVVTCELWRFADNSEGLAIVATGRTDTTGT